MACPRTLTICGEDNFSVTDKKEERLKRLQRAQWLRAAVLGANDGLVSVTSLMLGVGAAKEDQRSMVFSGIAGAIAGACSMAVGEFVSVSTQRDIENSVIDQRSFEAKISEEALTSVSQFQFKDGVDLNSMGNDGREIKIQITSNSNPSVDETKGNAVMSPALTPSKTPIPQPYLSHSISSERSAMMKVVISDATSRMHEAKNAVPNPYKAAAASAMSFLCGSLSPLLAAMLVADNRIRTVVIVIVASIALVLFGGFGAFLGGSSVRASAARVLLGGWISMAVTYSLLKPLDKDDKGGNNQKD